MFGAINFCFFHRPDSSYESRRVLERVLQLPLGRQKMKKFLFYYGSCTYKPSAIGISSYPFELRLRIELNSKRCDL